MSEIKIRQWRITEIAMRLESSPRNNVSRIWQKIISRVHRMCVIEIIEMVQEFDSIDSNEESAGILNVELK